MADTLGEIAAIADPFTKLRTATERMAAAQEEVTELARLRRQLIQELHDKGLSYAQIAEAAGLTRGRIHQLRHAGPAPEGAFLGIGHLIIATPLKQEAINARPVVAVEDFTAAQRLTELARTFGLTVEFEHVPLGGEIDLNRDGLIVICGPRLSDTVAKVLDTDPVLKFTRTDDGPWTLRDTATSETYQSGQDSYPATPTDVAYLGRLNRPDGNGTIIVFTGIHPPGTLAVVQHLSTEISNLYRELRTTRFSTLIGVEYEPSTNEPITVDRLTPLYRHEEPK